MRLLTARVMEAVKSAMLVDVVEDLRKLMLGGRELEVAKFIEARPHVVSVQVAGDGVLVGCCDGIMSDGEIEAFEEYGRAISSTLTTIDKRELEPFRLRGRKFVSEEQFGDQPRGVLPVEDYVELLYYRPGNVVLFPYRFSRVDLGSGRALLIVLGRSFKRERAAARHPVYGKVYRGEVLGVEVGVDALVKRGASIGALASGDRLRGRVSFVYVMGDEDLKLLLEALGGGHAG
jgi:hypothetical protein